MIDPNLIEAIEGISWQISFASMIQAIQIFAIILVLISIGSKSK